MIKEWFDERKDVYVEHKRIRNIQKEYKSDVGKLWTELVKQHDLLEAIAIADESVRTTLNGGDKENTDNYDYEAIAGSNEALLSDLIKKKEEHYKKSRIQKRHSKVFLSAIMIITLTLLLIGARTKDIRWIIAAALFGLVVFGILFIILFFTNPGIRMYNETTRNKLEKWEKAFDLVAKRKHTSVEKLAFYLSLYYDGIKVGKKKEDQTGKWAKIKGVLHWIFVDILELKWRFFIVTTYTSLALPGVLDFFLPDIFKSFVDMLVQIKNLPWAMLPLRTIIFGGIRLLWDVLTLSLIVAVLFMISALLVILVEMAANKVFSQIDDYIDLDDDYIFVKNHLFPKIFRSSAAEIIEINEDDESE